MKLFDCFTFMNEVEVLELRLAELYPVVDFFVLVEANRTHVGNHKEFIFAKESERFAEYLGKIIYIQVEDLPTSSDENMWVAEHFQRNAIMRGLEPIARRGDRVMVSDVDEIPSLAAIQANLDNPRWIVFKQALFYYFVNCRVRRNWGGTVMAPYGSFLSPQHLRNSARRHSFGVFRGGGWHYSYLVGANPERIAYKASNIVDAYSHYQLGDSSAILSNVMAQRDIYGRRSRYLRMSIVDITHDQPAAMAQFLQKYPWLYYQERAA